MSGTGKSTLAFILLTVFLGSAAAWTTTGTFHFGYATLVIGVNVLIGLGLTRWTPNMGWNIVGALILLSWRIYVWQGGDALSFPLLLIYLLLPGIAPPRITGASRGLAVYAMLVLEVILQYLPAWCLLALLTFPIAVRQKPVELKDPLHLAILIELFLLVGYIIKGLIR